MDRALKRGGGQNRLCPFPLARQRGYTAAAPLPREGLRPPLRTLAPALFRPCLTASLGRWQAQFLRASRAHGYHQSAGASSGKPDPPGITDAVEKPVWQMLSLRRTPRRSASAVKIGRRSEQSLDGAYDRALGRHKKNSKAPIQSAGLLSHYGMRAACCK